MLVDISNQILRKEKGVRIPPTPDYEKYFFVGWGFLRRIQMKYSYICLFCAKIYLSECRRQLFIYYYNGIVI